VSERRKALKQLQRMNVTAFSLFGNEESLMETLALDALVFWAAPEAGVAEPSTIPA